MRPRQTPGMAISPLSKILKALRAPSPRTSDQIRGDLQAIDMAALEAAVADLERQRKVLLLEGTDVELSENDKAIVSSNLACERAAAVTEELQRQLAEAESREAAEQIEQQAAEAMRAKERLSTVYAEVDARSTQIRALLGDAAEPIATLARWNRLAEKTGQADRRIAYSEVVAIKTRLQGTFR